MQCSVGSISLVESSGGTAAARVPFTGGEPSPASAELVLLFGAIGVGFDTWSAEDSASSASKTAAKAGQSERSRFPNAFGAIFELEIAFYCTPEHL